MQLDIRGRGFPLTAALRTHAERRLYFALSRFSLRLGRVVVRLSDLNGPKGGLDKRCHLLIPVLGGRVVSVEREAADLYAAVDLAADRGRQVVARELKRVDEQFPDAA